jgi:hypothetical protein
MSCDYSASVVSVGAAWRTLAQAAHRIAAGSVNARREPVPGSEDPISGREVSDSAPSHMQIDLAEELAKVDQSKIEIKANLRVMSLEAELERDTLDILA